MDEHLSLPGARLPSPMEEIGDPRLGGARLFLKRDDLIHPGLPGNKWRKLRDNLAEAARRGEDTLLTFGGAYSGHIRATAAAGRLFGFATIGVIRGEEHLPLNPSLAYAAAQGMRLTYMDRTTYRAKHTPEVIARLRAEHGRFHLIPEGGSNARAVRGCAELPAEIEAQGVAFDVICCAAGTGGTLAGIAAGLPPARRALGFSALKGGEFLAGEVERLRREAFGASSDNYGLECGFHFGGYARRTPELDAFAADFAARHGRVLEPVYVAKMMYGVFALAARGAFAPGTRIVAVVTG
ncbi:1-aminocyclopropane-1-carboxylate deaminase [Sphaerisporangium siamense]|uniref:1-aminocyclopropane-1-carboxylate deaminase n=1 Tax=Sphaerisporangium siamense TaxID=795645 RepID=A0A7W7GD15_9ACTN|nr:pyridoxal-phosphate dependent enzyme [Sphaerisporangium siamense]MBB4705127.1 1-aminocyclopropane-1-carboxylate deaminase [Sphaerisporangium siamense]GII83933.1 1-aminocyclopropane-1-carboxylate deaminase [Sphaerisporangium siamense]